MINTDSYIAFVRAAVHIPVHHKIYASGLVNIDNLYIVFPVIFPVVDPLITDKTKHLYQLIACLIIAPKLSALYKADNVPFFIRCIFHVLSPYTKLNVAVINRKTFCPENLLHRPFII